MATLTTKPSGKLYIQWKELVVTQHPDGTVRREWATRARTFPKGARREAEQFKRDIETAAARGERLEDVREKPVATMRDMIFGYVKAARDGGAPEATVTTRSSLLGGFLDFIRAREAHDPGAKRLVTELSLELLERYAGTLPAEGRKADTRHRKVLLVEKAWAWAHDRPQAFPGVPEPRRLTGGTYDADKIRLPPPVVAVAAPTWQELDRMIAHLTRDLHRRIALLLRFTGLRISQATGLVWSDVDLDRRILTIRAGLRGAKRGATRVIPLHPWLAEEMATWAAMGQRSGPVFPAPKRQGACRKSNGYAAFRRAWELSGVPRDRWDIPDGDETQRAQGRPAHAFRAAVKTGLLRLEQPRHLVDYYIGHAPGGDTERAYVPEDCPEQSPYWDALMRMVEKIPVYVPVAQTTPPVSYRNPYEPSPEQKAIQRAFVEGLIARARAAGIEGNNRALMLAVAGLVGKSPRTVYFVRRGANRLSPAAMTQWERTFQEGLKARREAA